MFARWKIANTFAKTNVDTISPAPINSGDIRPRRGIGFTSERTFLRKGHYFCLIQYTPYPSTFVFTEPGDYIIGCNCTNNLGNLVPVPLGPYPEYRGSCGYLRIKVRDRNISVRQAPPITAPAFQGNGCGAFEFLKETAKGFEVFSSMDSAENCKFRMIPKNGINASGKAINDSCTCSFSFRRILLGVDRPNPIRRCIPTIPVEAASNLNSDGSNHFTEYQLSVSRRFEVFLDTRLGKGGNGEVFLAIDRRHGAPVAIKREPKEMLRHEYTLICDIRIEGSLLTYKAQDPHPSKFLGLMAHSVALEVGNSAVAAAVAHHSAVGDTHDHLVLELVNGGELRKLLKSKYSTGMPLEVARAYIYQIICSLVLIHSKCIVHRDLKTQNILVRHGDTFQNDELKIIDFGNSTKVRPGLILTKNYTTCFACAPEQFIPNGKGYSYGVDVWAAGTIFFELLTGERLFECLNMSEASRQIPAFKEKDVTDRLPFLRQDAMEFLLKCLTKDPQKRPTAFQLLTSPFLFSLHIYQMRRRMETTDVYHSYMNAFEKGWGNIRPIQELFMAEKLQWDGDSSTFFSECPDPEAVNVVLPVFECVPDFQSQDHGIKLGNWILTSDASFYLTQRKVDGSSHVGLAEAPTQPNSKNSPASSFTSTGSSPERGESFSSPEFMKLLPDNQLYPQPNGFLTCGMGVPRRSSTCSTSIGTPVHGSLMFGGADKLTDEEEEFETLVNRIDLL